jgi:hypothetical protein
VFDPLAVALIIAFNGLIEDKKKKQREILTEMMRGDEELGLYEIYGDKKEDLVENNSQNTEDSGKKSTLEEETPIIVENISQEEEQTPNLKWEEYMHPEFPWNNKKLWINNPKAVNYWLNTQRGTHRDLAKMINEEDNVKTY